MYNKKNNRIFIFLRENDKGFLIGDKVRGFIKIEITSQLSKISANIENLKPIEGNKVFKLYLLSNNYIKYKPILIGEIKSKGNKGYFLNKVYDSKTDFKNYSIFNYNTVIIKYEDEISKNQDIIIPLIGFKDVSWNWKEAFKEYIFSKKQEINNKISLNKKSQLDNKEKSQTVSKEKIKNIEDMKITEKAYGNKEIPLTKEVNKNNDSLIAYLSSYSPEISPFINGDMGYSWWRIDNCEGFINDLYTEHYTILNNYNNMTKSNLMLINNPYVIYAARKYGYILIGIKQDTLNNIEHISYAIPTRYISEPHPLIHIQEHTFWVPKKGEIESSNSIGYWIMNIKVDIGNLTILE